MSGLGTALFALACVWAAEPAPEAPPLVAPETAMAASAAKKIRLVFAGIGGEVKDNVARAVRLKALIRRSDASPALIERAYRQAPAQIAAALAPFGFDQPKVQGTITREGSSYRIRFQIDPGPPTRVTTLAAQVEGPGGEDRNIRRVLSAFKPAVGDVFLHAEYEASKAEVQRMLQARGYFDARLLEHRVAVRRGEHSAEVQVRWDSGPRYRFGALQFSGGTLDPVLLQRYRSFDEGDPYSQNRLLELQQRLTDADYFSSVEISVEPEEAVDLAVPVRVRLLDAKQTIYTGGLSFGTDSGAGINGGLERRYVNAAGHKLLAQAEYSQNLQAAALGYRIPRSADYRSYFAATAQLRNEQTDQFETDSLRLGTERVDLWHGWERSASLNLLDGDFVIGGARADGGVPGSSTLLYPELRLKRREVDDPTAPRAGWSAILYLRAGASALLSDTDLLQAGGEARYIRSMDDRQRLLFRAAVGASWVDDFDRLPPELRYYAGGDTSVRGYGYQELGPRNAAGRVLGGEYLLTASAEYEYALSGPWSVATFVDAGNAFSSSAFTPEVGLGFGVRWRSPVGLVRLDLGFPLDDPGAPRPHLVIGPDL